MFDKKSNPFGSKGPEGQENGDEKANELNGAKGGGMKHVVTPGADKGSTMQDGGMDEAKKRMMMIALMRAMAQGGGQPPMGGQPMGGGMPMGGSQGPM